ncbi:MAG TPA: hypothetical protein VLE70_20815 [Anaerolineae bacterium]|jgi:hypothetical protein|nr:hypothetical protein [Anaerolineae bacterium]
MYRRRVTAGQLPELSIIPSMQPALPLLIADQERDPSGSEPVQLGIGHYRPDSSFEQTAWT